MSNVHTAVVSILTWPIALSLVSCARTAHDSAHMLSGDQYGLTISSVSQNTCNLPITAGPLVGVAIGVHPTPSGYHIAPSVADYPISVFVPAFDVAKVADALSGSGSSVLSVDSSCTLTLAGTATGTITGDNSFDLALDIVVSASGTAPNGTPSNCSGNAGGVIKVVDAQAGSPEVDVRFPTLSNIQNGSCAVSFAARGLRCEYDVLCGED